MNNGRTHQHCRQVPTMQLACNGQSIAHHRQNYDQVSPLPQGGGGRSGTAPKDFLSAGQLESSIRRNRNE